MKEEIKEDRFGCKTIQRSTTRFDNNFIVPKINITRILNKMKKPTHGGKRKRSGRKPASDPKQQVTLYVETSIIKANGGLEKSKSECYLFLKKQGRKPK